MGRRKRERRLHETPIVRAVAAILDSGHPTRYRFEAAIRHGLRASKCLEGWPWPEADEWARRVVLFAEHRIGLSTRPTWAQGQPEPVDRSERCYWCNNCGKPIEAGDRWLYCSDLCSHAASERRRNANRRDEAEALALAFDAAKANGELERQCGQCGETFALNRDMGIAAMRQRYCSRECALASKRVNRIRKCMACGQPFRRGKVSQKFCSHACAYGNRRTDKIAVDNFSST